MATRDDVLVTTDWLAQRLDDPAIRIVEVDEDTDAYGRGHIPGAVAVNWNTDLQDPLRRDFIDPEQFAKLQDSLAITPDTLVVLYGGNNNWFAAYAYWYFKVYGHEPVKLLDGGRKAWELEGRELTTDTPAVNATEGYPVRKPDFSIRAFRDQVLNEYLGSSDRALVDVRSPEEYRGEKLAPDHLPQEQAQRPGHIPGAANIPWARAVDGTTGKFLTDQQLSELYGGQGITPDKDVVAYCRIGERSAHTWFVLHELLDYPSVRNYDGSWTEWGSLVGVPIER
ncbi:MAG TPA: sulfurtransferase [Actinomycetes bacterium]|jgi:thiosulfate/3-mercaptopyruvate sulfurtransferase|nr:sulfurtransferase [Actinomycetes bacterium]